MSDVAVTEALGELLSPSQVCTYMTCPAKWYFRYLVGLSEPATGALALGKTFHATPAQNFRQKMSTGRDLQTGELAEAFDAEFSAALSEAELRDDEDPAELASTGRAIVVVYVEQAAPSVKPQSVEQTVQGEIAGVAVRGIVDLLDLDGCVFDFKTSSKRPNRIPAEHSIQLTTYTMITPEASGLCRLDTITKAKTVNIAQQSFRVSADDRRFGETLYPMVQESIRDGIYPPHRSSPTCSRRYCGCWRECERELHVEARPLRQPGAHLGMLVLTSTRRGSIRWNVSLG